MLLAGLAIDNHLCNGISNPKSALLYFSGTNLQMRFLGSCPFQGAYCRSRALEHFSFRCILKLATAREM
jgi:hypothetical protein